MHQQQFRLRLGEGTLLLVDRDALNTWLVDERAMVQPVGTRRWRSLRQYIADEKEAAFFAPPAAPAPAAESTGDQPPRATRLADVLVPPPPKNASPAPAVAAEAPVIPFEEPAFVLPVEPQVDLAFEPAFEPAPAPALNEPLAVTNVPFVPVEEESPRVEAVAAAPVPPAPEPEPVPLPPAAPVEESLVASLQSMAATLETPPSPPPPAARPRPAKVPVPAPFTSALTEEELELTVPKMALQEYAPQPQPEPEPLPIQLEPDPEPEPIRPEPSRVRASAPPPLQVLADMTATAEPEPPALDDLPAIALKPFDDGPARESPLHVHPIGKVYTPAPAKPNVVEAVTQMANEWSTLMRGWVDALDQRGPRGRPQAASSAAPASRELSPRDLELEPLETIELLDEPPAAPAGEALATVVRRRAAAACASAAGVASRASETLSGWLAALRRRQAALTQSRPRQSAEERRAAMPETSPGPLEEDFRETPPAVSRVPAAPPVPVLKPPPSLQDVPVIRLAPIAEAAPEPEDLYDGDEYYGPSPLDHAGAWAKRIVLAAALVIFGVVAANTWQVWLPKAGGFGVKVVDEIENRVRPGDAAAAETLRRAVEALPHLSPDTIALVLSRRAVSAPGEVFHAAHDAAARGMSALGAGEAGELAALRRELASSLSPMQQVQLRDYERVQRVVPSVPEGPVVALVAQGAARLSPQQRERLQLLTGKAVAAGLPPAAAVTAAGR